MAVACTLAFTRRAIHTNALHLPNTLQDKNKDFVVAEHQMLMAGSSFPFVVELFREPADAGEGAGRWGAVPAAVRMGSLTALGRLLKVDGLSHVHLKQTARCS